MHDKFHVVAYLNKGIDETRKQEVKTEPLLKKAKYVMLKTSENLTDKQKIKFMEINQANLLTARACGKAMPLAEDAGEFHGTLSKTDDRRSVSVF